MTGPGLFALPPLRYPTLGLSFQCPNFISGLSPEGDVGAQCQGLPAGGKGVLTTQTLQFPKTGLTLVSSEG